MKTASAHVKQEPDEHWRYACAECGAHAVVHGSPSECRVCGGESFTPIGPEPGGWLVFQPWVPGGH